MPNTTHRDILDTLNNLKDAEDELAKEVAETREVVKAWAVVRGGGQFIITLGKIVAGIAIILGGIKIGVLWLLGNGVH